MTGNTYKSNDWWITGLSRGIFAVRSSVAEWYKQGGRQCWVAIVDNINDGLRHDLWESLEIYSRALYYIDRVERSAFLRPIRLLYNVFFGSQIADFWATFAAVLRGFTEKMAILISVTITVQKKMTQSTVAAIKVVRICFHLNWLLFF